MSNRKKLILVFDALPYFLNNNLNLEKNIQFFKEIIPMKSIIGYSCGLYPTIWSGLYPQETNLWNTVKFRNSKKNITKNKDLVEKLFRIFCYFPFNLSALISLSLFFLNRLLSKFFHYRYPAYYDFKISRFFYIENSENFIFKNSRSIFSILKTQQRDYYYFETKKYGSKISQFFRQLPQDIIFYFNPIMDELGHKCGPLSKEYQNILRDIYAWVQSLIESQKYDIFLFSDHGMTPASHQYNPKNDFNELKKKFDVKIYRDFIVWRDSTMLRFWGLNDNFKKNIDSIKKLFNLKKIGHFLTDEEVKINGLEFKQNYFGDLIFLVNPHWEIFPNFFNAFNLPKPLALHGYSPENYFSYGIFYSNLLKNGKVMELPKIMPLLKSFLNL